MIVNAVFGNAQKVIAFAADTAYHKNSGIAILCQRVARGSIYNRPGSFIDQQPRGAVRACISALVLCPILGSILLCQNRVDFQPRILQRFAKIRCFAGRNITGAGTAIYRVVCRYAQQANLAAFAQRQSTVFILQQHSAFFQNLCCLRMTGIDKIGQIIKIALVIFGILIRIPGLYNIKGFYIQHTADGRCIFVANHGSCDHNAGQQHTGYGQDFSCNLLFHQFSSFGHEQGKNTQTMLKTSAMPNITALTKNSGGKPEN